mgnify:CR=1 FL=1
MDYEKILEEQMNNVIDPRQADIISENAGKASGGLTDGFTLENILDATLNGESIFNSQELIDGLKSMVIYEIRAAMVLGVEILIICIVIGLLKNLSSSFGKKSMDWYSPQRYHNVWSMGNCVRLSATLRQSTSLWIRLCSTVSSKPPQSE